MSAARPPASSPAPSLLVADAGPLIVLGCAGLLPLVAQRHQPLLVPQPVLQECLAKARAPGAAEVAQALQAGHLMPVPEGAIALEPADRRGLGLGEVSVIQYALQQGLVALLDDRKARATAVRLGVRMVGSGAVLVGLKTSGALHSIAPTLSLWSQHGYYLSPEVQRALLHAAGELELG